MRRWIGLLLLAAALGACVDQSRLPVAPSPFRAEDNVVPAAVDPDRPRPPPPSPVEVLRTPRAPSP